MKQVHDLMAHTLENGQPCFNARTGEMTRASVGHMLKFDLREGHPAITTKKLAFNVSKGELIGFMRGYTSAAQFRELGCNIWNQNANENLAWLANPARRGVDDLGRFYPVQWTDLRDWREANSAAEYRRLLSAGYSVIAEDSVRGVWVMRRSINQLEVALEALLKDPSDRGVCVTAWNPAEFDLMALRPCHCDYRFNILPDGTLHSTLGLRSSDEYLGLPFNINFLAILTSIMARLTGTVAATASVFITNAHLYENHIEQTKVMLSREHFPAPKLMLSDRIQRITDRSLIKGVFARIQMDDIWLEGYQSHAALKAPMAP